MVALDGTVDVLLLALVLEGPMPGLAFALAVAGAAVGRFAAVVGVFVLEVAALELPFPAIGFVGDFEGEPLPLGPPKRELGVGLAAVLCKLCLFSAFVPTPATLCRLLLAAVPLAAVLGLALTSSSTWRTPAGRKNMP